jgi:hypothetical protein
VLTASVLGLEDPVRTTFIGTWVALTGGIPDMFRSSGNATADGMSAIIFSNNFERFFSKTLVAVPVILTAGCYRYEYVPLASAPVGEEVRVHLSEQGFARLIDGQRDEAAVTSPRLDGRLELSADNLVVLTVTLPSDPGNSRVDLRQRLLIPAGDVLQVERRQLDKTKTAIVAVGTTALVAALVVRSVSGTFGGSTKEPPPQESENRIPQFCSWGFCSRLRLSVPGIFFNQHRR